MKALSSSKKPTLVITLSIIASLILLGVGAYAYFASKSQDLPATPQGTIKQEQVSSSPQTSQSTLPSKPGGQTNPPPSAETPSTPPEKPTIERASGNPTIKVVATFQKASSGYCELQLSQPSQQTLSYTSTITVSSSYYICSFSITRSDLPADGLWKATIIHHIGTAATPSDAKDIE